MRALCAYFWIVGTTPNFAWPGATKLLVTNGADVFALKAKHVPADTAGQYQADMPAQRRQLPQACGASAVTANVAAAVKESLLLSVPADAMLSSAIFGEFTREVAARIIQHYWRQHASKRAAPSQHIRLQPAQQAQQQSQRLWQQHVSKQAVTEDEFDQQPTQQQSIQLRQQQGNRQAVTGDQFNHWPIQQVSPQLQRQQGNKQAEAEDWFDHQPAQQQSQQLQGEHIARVAAAEGQYDPPQAQRQNQHVMDESGQQPHDRDSDHNDAQGVPALIQDDSLPELLMRYRAGSIPGASQQQTQADISVHQLGVNSCHVQITKVAVQGSSIVYSRAGSAAKGRKDGSSRVHPDVTGASSSSLDRLKARHSKQRPVLSNKDTAAQHAQRADAKQRPGAAQQTAVTSLRAAAARADECRGTSGGDDSSDQDEQSSTVPACEDSDSALFQLLNPNLQEQATALMSAVSVLSRSVSGSAREQSMPGMASTQGAAADIQDVCDENASPNVSPSKGGAHQRKQQQQPQSPTPDVTNFGSGAEQEADARDVAASAERTAGGALHQAAASRNLRSAPLTVADKQTEGRHTNQHRSDRLSSDKLIDIFAFLDDVEAQTEEQAAAVLSQGSSQALAQQSLPQGPAQQASYLGTAQQPSAHGPAQQPSSVPLGERALASCAHSHATPTQQLRQLYQGPLQERGRADAPELLCLSSAALPAGNSALGGRCQRAVAGAEAVHRTGLQEREAARFDVRNTGVAADTADTASTGEADAECEQPNVCDHQTKYCDTATESTSHSAARLQHATGVCVEQDLRHITHPDFT